MNIKIFTTFDCVKPTEFEKLVLAVIKGVLYEFKHLQPEPYSKEESIYHITLKPTNKSDGTMTTFKIEYKTPVGLFEEVKRLITPFCFGFVPQGGFNEETGHTSIIIQRFEVKRESINYYNAVGVRK